MLLKVGVVMMLVSLVLAAGVVAVVSLQSDISKPPSLPAEPQSVVEETEKEEKEKRQLDHGRKLEIDNGSSEANEEEQTPVAVPDWPEPTAGEVAAANSPRYYQPTAEADMALTIEALSLYDVPVISSPSYEVLDRGLMHEPETSLPWDGGAGRNVFLAGHYLGWPGTASHLVFYNLDKLRGGEEVLLRDAWGRAYRYRVSESFEATPYDSWVMGREVGRDMLTLQTCIPPSFEERLVVRADRA
jgi:sortase A